MTDRMSEHYHRMMREPAYRERADATRKTPLVKRVDRQVSRAALFGCLSPFSMMLFHQPHLFWGGVAAALVAVYNLSVFLVDSAALTMDLRARDDAPAHLEA